MRNYFISASLIAGLLLAYTTIVLANKRTWNASLANKQSSTAMTTVEPSSSASR